MTEATGGIRSAKDREAAPLLGLQGLALAILIAAVLTWPVMVADGPFYFFDTVYYVERGATIFEVAAGPLLGDGISDDGGLPSQGEATLAGMKIRSLPWALYAFMTASTGPGLYLTCLLQGVVVIWTFFALVPASMLRDPLVSVGAFCLVGLFSGLPWFVSYAMPDILGAILPIYFICLMRRVEELEPWQQWVLALIAAGAIATHYGNQPLAAALAFAVLIWRGRKRRLRLRIVILILGPVVAALGVNLAVGFATAGSDPAQAVSAAPKRLPIMLARSIEDGPARWYLDDACPEAGYATCDLFETMPENISAFLWAENGYMNASDKQIEAIGAEENAILWEAFKRYPFQQTRALFGNSASQIVKVGLDDMYPLPPDAVATDDIAPPDRTAKRPEALVIFDSLVPLATAVAAILYLVLVATGWIDRRGREALALLLIALAVNALIFGGLSAPVDRYQGRIAWLIPALLALYAMPRSVYQWNSGATMSDRALR